jgi:hypothetical protein
MVFPLLMDGEEAGHDKIQISVRKEQPEGYLGMRELQEGTQPTDP